MRQADPTSGPPLGALSDPPSRIENGAAQPSRFYSLDAARGLAVLAMAAYHFTWDLDYFGLAPVGVAQSGWFRILGHAIATAFFLIVGASLVLATRRGFRLAPFLQRLGVIALAALAITAATWFATPSDFIFFGVLHCIVVASLFAAPFLRAPLALVVIVAAAAVALPFIVANPAFNAPYLLWTGLGVREPATNDWRPFLPWFGVVLFGLAGARLVLMGRFSAPGLETFWGAGWPQRALVRIGQRSLLIYLAHQPILFAALYAGTFMAGMKPPSDETTFTRSCSAQCVARGADKTYCDRVCGCVATRTAPTPLWRDVMANQLSPDERESFNGVARQCMREIKPSPP